MNFKKFDSIENHYREKFIDYLYANGYKNIPYIATEKIHGANFSFWTDGQAVRVASRTQWTDAGFYNCSQVIDKYEDIVLKLKRKHFPEAEYITIYGELYGTGIQKGIYYGDEKDFVAFDLQVDGYPQLVGMSRQILESMGIPIVPQIGVYDNLDKALGENNTFQSKLYPCDKENIAEGLVIQPITPVILPDGSRLMIKSKTDKFQERAKAKKSSTKTDNPYTSLAKSYVNENRMNSVLSKLGEVTNRDFGKIIGLMSKDTYEDILKEIDYIPADDYKVLGKACNQVVAKFLKENLLRKI